MSRDSRGSRIPALDSLRGVLALVVVVHHVLLLGGWPNLPASADVAVLAFFVMSGLVLARAYDGRPVAFLARRAVRLWPTYGVCMLASFVVAGLPLSGGYLFWLPPLPLERLGIVNLPAWTLYVEVWATPVLVVLFWIAQRGQAIAWLTAAAFCLLVGLDQRLFALPLFAAGVALAGTKIPWPASLPGWSLWLGKISYSLYISHWVVLKAVLRIGGQEAAPVALPLALGVAWVVWRWVERPSISLSRRVGGSTALIAVRSP
jgi:peptidoglycan/LPS O-acetylase OafA/YrhL